MKQASLPVAVTDIVWDLTVGTGNPEVDPSKVIRDVFSTYEQRFKHKLELTQSESFALIRNVLQRIQEMAQP